MTQEESPNTDKTSMALSTISGEIKTLCTNIKTHVDGIREITLRLQPPRNFLANFPPELTKTSFAQFQASDQVQYLTEHLQDRFINDFGSIPGILDLVGTFHQEGKDTQKFFGTIQRKFGNEALRQHFSHNNDEERRGIHIIPAGKENSFSWQNLLDLFRDKVAAAQLPEQDKQTIDEHLDGIAEDFQNLINKMPRLKVIGEKMNPPAQGESLKK